MDYKPNSNKARRDQQTTERRKVEKVVANPVKIKKKSEIKKVADVFIAEDVENVKTYVFRDILIPTFKDMVVNIIKTSVEMLVYGDTRGTRSSSGSRTSYSSSYYNNSSSRPATRSSVYGRGFDIDDITFVTLKDADDVLYGMHEILKEYGSVSVAEFYDLFDDDYTPPFTANDYGWFDLRSAKPVMVQGGWRLRLPRPVPLK